MILLKTFWTPIMVYSVKTGCKFIAAYTIATSVFLISLIVYMSYGGESTQMYNPFFETDLDKLNSYVILSIIFFTYMIISSLLMLKGIKENFRVFLLPWIFGMEASIAFILIWSFWLLKSYCTYNHIVCYVVLYWIVSIVQLYCWLCVHTQYQIILKQQKPKIQHV